ncbi:MAG: hypothetical protein AMJ77_06700 [Dehalococcoidia bacterium SM23_28_2]|nr:MAG: hypothetical protein AMJ77_06700 [Dehalococcoidia bacterium SM23_28_2]
MRPRTWLLVLTALIAGAFLLLAVGCEEEAPEIAKYPQAEEVKTGSRGIFPIALSGDKPLEAHEYRANMRYRTFETEDSADQVLDFYNDEFTGWKTELTLDTGETGAKTVIAVWSKDDRKSAAWLVATEAEGITEVVAMTGTR